MLSYRHGFHAGNFADVLKHSLLTLVINALKQKDKPFVYIDTHAGAGKYYLKSDFAQKTGEFKQGIGLLWKAEQPIAEVKDYLAAIRAENTGKQLVRYPGSPQIARRLIRDQDRLVLSELHSADYEHLHHLYAQDKQVIVAKEDGLGSLEKKLPPIQRRGLILIDPSYEMKSDFKQVISTLNNAYQRFATGIYGLWYPIINRGVTEKMLQSLADTGIRKQLRIEHCLRADSACDGMTGSGVLFINPPWQLEAQAKILLPWLDQVLGNAGGNWKVEWQVHE